MATNNLGPDVNPCDPVTASDFNNVRLVLKGDFVPHNNPNGDVDACGGNIGTAVLPWDNGYFCSNVFVDGKRVLLEGTDDQNCVNSGETVTTSDAPCYIRPDGTTNELTLRSTLTPLELTINGDGVTYNADIVVNALTTGPSTNNTCDVDDVTLTGQPSSKLIGEYRSTLTIDNAGTEITDRIGQFAPFLNGSEIMWMYIKSATELTNGFRGFFYDSSCLPIGREVLSDNDTLTLLQGGWVFAQNDSATVDVSYLTPIYDFVEPPSPDIGQYWLDLGARQWKRFGGGGFVNENRTLVGVVALNATAAIGARSEDFCNQYNALNTISPVLLDDTTVTTEDQRQTISVYGNKITWQDYPTQWNITTDIESGQSQTPDTLYYLYISQDGQNVISDIAPYTRPILRGSYHPYNSWRCAGVTYNDASDNLIGANVCEAPSGTSATKQEFLTDGAWIKPAGATMVLVTGWGGGGGGARESSGINAGSGGGGGAYKEARLCPSTLPDFALVTVGVGGAGGDGDDSSGADGTDSLVGSFFAAYGGQGGSPATSFGGISGGWGAGMVAGFGGPVTGFESINVGGGAGGIGSSSGTDAFPGGAAGNIYAGGGGGGGNASAAGTNTRGVGGNAMYGGAGGGGGSDTGGGASGGISVYGGNGGQGVTGGGAAGDGGFPAGGGGGAETGDGGAGGNGKIIIYTFF